MDSHLDGRTGPQSYIEALPNIPGTEDRHLICCTGGWEISTVALPLVDHGKADVGNILDHKNKESTNRSYYVLELG